MDIDIIDVEGNDIIIIDTDGNSYTISLDSEVQEESQVAAAILELAFGVMETYPPDDEDGESSVPYFEDDEDDY